MYNYLVYASPTPAIFTKMLHFSCCVSTSIIKIIRKTLTFLHNSGIIYVTLFLFERKLHMSKILNVLLSSILLFTCYSGSITASATDFFASVSGKVYEFDADSDYDTNINNYAGTTNELSILGTVSLNGIIDKTYSKDGITAFEIADNKNLTICFNYTKELLETNKMEWHIGDEGDDEICGFELEDDIDSGAVILLTSLNHQDWYLKSQYVDIVDTINADSATKTFQTNSVELSNGCYYKVIAAYRLESVTEEGIIWDDKEGMKVVEAFEFYAQYKSADDKYDYKNDNKHPLGETVYAGNDDGFSKKEERTESDPHYGWEIGNFFISGFTSFYDDNTFTKNVGDRVTLWFNLNQKDLNKLNGDSSLYIAEDTNGFDQQFQTGKPNFKHGALIVRYTNYEGIKSEPQIYTDYLAALSSPGADTKIQLFEEGDYEVALDYQVNKDVAVIADPEYDYRIYFNFKIRNGNCMVYPLDVVTGEELPNTAVTENGFKLDLARSRYLKINIVYSRIIKTENGYNEDTRKNIDSKDGAEFTEEGIYTITVSNPTTGAQTEKKIYVGKDNIVKASINPENQGLTINQIAAKVYDGATINDDGTINDPPPKEAESSSSADNDTDSVLEAAAESSLNETDNNSIVSDNSIVENEKEFDIPYIPIAAGAGGLMLIILTVAVFRKTKGGKKNE